MLVSRSLTCSIGSPSPSNPSDTGGKPPPNTTGNGNTASPTDPSKTASGNNNNKNQTTTAPTHTTFAPDSPVGGVSIIVPAATALGTPLYKIGDYVTFSWNYTSLLGTPTAVDVLASCTAARATWTLTANMSFATAVNYVWDTKVQQNDASQPLLTEQYSLIVKDSDIGMNDQPDPGYLGSYPALSFGLYARQYYVNLSDWKCPGCHASAASPAIGGQSLKFATAMCLATVLGLGWLN